MASSLGFVGLGVMGGPMAAHLAKAGHPVTVWNRSAGKGDQALEAGAQWADSLESLAVGCDLIFLCVRGSEDVQEVAERIASSAKPGTLVVDHSTIAPAAALEIGEMLAKRGLRFVEAPITGGSMGAQAGTLTVFLGGSEADVAEALPFIRAYSKVAERVGGPGAGQTMKLANQIAVGGALMALCETLAFAQKAGLDLRTTRDLIGSGAGGSWAFQHYGEKILNNDWTPGFSVLNQRKDFGYVSDRAEQLNAFVPGSLLCDRLLEKLEESGRGEHTTAALFEVMAEMGYAE